MDRPFVALPARLELTTLRLGGARSIQVSYGSIPCILPNGEPNVKKNMKKRILFEFSSLQDGFFRL